MRRLPIILLAVGLIGAGCNSTGKKPPAPANQSGPNPGGAFGFEDRPINGNSVKGAPARDAEGMLAGQLIDSEGRAQPNALVNVTTADAGPNGKPIGVQADEQGYFIIKGLTAGTTYFLSVRGDNGGKTLGGSVMTQATNTHLLIQMREGNFAPATPATLPPPKTPAPAAPDKKDGKPKLDPPTSSIPNPEPVPASKDPLTSSDQSWGPGKAPPVSQPPPPPPSKGNPNVADSNSNSWPPKVSIPNSVGTQTPATADPPPPPVSPSMSAVPSNSSPLTGTLTPPTQQQQPQQHFGFTLYDAGGNAVEFRHLSDRRLIVLDFWSTSCMPCLRKIPALIDLQAKYASYVEVAGIACDDLPWAQRKKAVEGIKDYYLRKEQKPINYGVWFEGEGQEGRVQSQFKIKVYPTMILLDHAGRELWRGSDVRQLEESIKYYLMRK